MLQTSASERTGIGELLVSIENRLGAVTPTAQAARNRRQAIRLLIDEAEAQIRRGVAGKPDNEADALCADILSGEIEPGHALARLYVLEDPGNQIIAVKP